MDNKELTEENMWEAIGWVVYDPVCYDQIQEASAIGTIIRYIWESQEKAINSAGEALSANGDTFYIAMVMTRIKTAVVFMSTKSGSPLYELGYIRDLTEKEKKTVLKIREKILERAE